jgi:hypothetical protein
MPRASIVWTSWTIAALCWKPSIIKGFSQGAQPVAVTVADEIDDDELLVQLGVEAVVPADITATRPLGCGQTCRRGDRQSPEIRRFRAIQAVVRTGLERTQRGPAADKGVRTKVRDLDVDGEALRPAAKPR